VDIGYGILQPVLFAVLWQHRDQILALIKSHNSHFWRSIAILTIGSDKLHVSQCLFWDAVVETLFLEPFRFLIRGRGIRSAGEHCLIERIKLLVEDGYFALANRCLARRLIIDLSRGRLLALTILTRQHARLINPEVIAQVALEYSVHQNNPVSSALDCDLFELAANR